MERLREVLAFVNHKGGVGKTTTVQSLAAGLRRFGKGQFGEDADGRKRLPRILIIDLDPQACASFLYGWSETLNVGKPTVYDALVQQSNLPVYQVREGVYLAPAAAQLISIEPFLNQRAVPRKALCKLFAKPLNEMAGTELADEGVNTVVDAFDYVLIDGYVIAHIQCTYGSYKRSFARSARSVGNKRYCRNHQRHRGDTRGS